MTAQWLLKGILATKEYYFARNVEEFVEIFGHIIDPWFIW